jgi:hypothetical protein
MEDASIQLRGEGNMDESFEEGQINRLLLLRNLKK